MTTNTTTASPAQAVRRPRYNPSMTAKERENYNLQQRLYRLSRKSSFHPADYLDDHTAAQIEAVLGGVEVGKSSPRGFVKWTPDAESQKLLDEIHEALDLYRAHLPLTARQVYYVLLDKYHHDKGTTFETALYYVMERGRRGEQIDMDVIRDDSGTKEETVFWDDAEEWLSNKRYQAAHARLDRQEGQKRRLHSVLRSGRHGPATFPRHRPIWHSGLCRPAASTAYRRSTRSPRRTPTLKSSTSAILMRTAIEISSRSRMMSSAFAAEFGNHVSFTRLAVTPELVDSSSDLPTSPYSQANKKG